MLDILARHPSTAQLHFEQAGAAVRGRRSAAGAGRAHGQDLPRHGWRHPRGDEDHARRRRNSCREGAYRAKIKSPFEMVVSAVRATGARGGFRVSAGEPDRAAGRAAVSQAGAHRIFERQARMDELRGAAGAHEFRAAAGAKQRARREGGRVDPFAGRSRGTSRGRSCSRDPDRQTLASIEKAGSNRHPSARSGARAWCWARPSFRGDRSSDDHSTHFSQEFGAGDVRHRAPRRCGCRARSTPPMRPVRARRFWWRFSSAARSTV